MLGGDECYGNERALQADLWMAAANGIPGEFASAFNEGKLISVLKGNGSVTEKIPHNVASFGDKDTGARVIYEVDLTALIEQLVTTYIVQHYRKLSCSIKGAYLTGAGDGEVIGDAMMVGTCRHRGGMFVRPPRGVSHRRGAPW